MQCHSLYIFPDVDEYDDDGLQPENVPQEDLSLELHLRLHVLLLLRIQRAYARPDDVPHHGHLQEDLRAVALGAAPQLLVLQRVPSFLAVAYLQQRYRHLAEEFHLVVPVLVVHRHLQDGVDVLHVAENETGGNLLQTNTNVIEM